MTKRMVCLLLAILAAAELHAPAFALAASAGPGGEGSGISASADTRTSLPAPKVKIAKTGSGIHVSWNAVQGSPLYMVYYRENGGKWHKIGATAKTSYVRKTAKLNNGSTYEFTVRCCAKDKKTLLSGYAASNSLKYTVQLAAPAVKIAKTSGGIQVSWNAVQGSPLYMVYYRENGGAWHKIGATSKTAYTRKTAKLKNGVTYQFTVRCCGNDKKTLLSGYAASNSLKYSVQLAAPTVKIAAAANGIKVTWNKVAGAARYAVYYREGNGGWHKIGTTTSTSYTWKKAVSGKSYSFTVRCTDAAKANISAYKSSNKLTYIAAPTIRTAANADGGVKVTWNAVNGAARYRVFYRIGSGGWKKAGDTAGTSYTVAGLKSGNTYAFTVRCLSSNSQRYVSSYDNGGKSLLYLAAPAVKLVNVNNALKATWNKVAGASKYKVYFRAKGSGGWHLLGETKSTSYTWDDAVLGMSYSFTVRAVGGGATSAYTGSAYVRYTGTAASPTDI